LIVRMSRRLAQAQRMIAGRGGAAIAFKPDHPQARIASAGRRRGFGGLIGRTIVNHDDGRHFRLRERRGYGPRDCALRIIGRDQDIDGHDQLSAETGHACIRMRILRAITARSI
jgi:hypothetical protein